MTFYLLKNGPSSKLKCRMKGIIEIKPEAYHVYKAYRTDPFETSAF